MSSIATIDGIGPDTAHELRALGVRSSKQLLARAGDLEGRRTIATHCEVTEEQVLGWAKRADLMRVRGVGAEFSDLLGHIGIETAKELAKRRADRLYNTCLEAARSTDLVRRLPSSTEVEGWVEHAKTLAPAVSG